MKKRSVFKRRPHSNRCIMVSWLPTAFIMIFCRKLWFTCLFFIK